MSDTPARRRKPLEIAELRSPSALAETLIELKRLLPFVTADEEVGARPATVAALGRETEPHFEEVARLIARKKPTPDWLPAALQERAIGLAFARRQEEERLGRAEMREHLLRRETAVRDEMCWLADIPTMEHLDRAAGEQVNVDTNFYGNILRELADFYARAAAKIKTGPGQGRAEVGAPATAKICCAMIIAAAWERVHGALPKPGNPTTQQAARDYWRASGGTEERGWGENRLQGWRERFRAIERYTDQMEHIRSSLHRSLGERSGRSP